jgi:phosphohistidine phosphatase
MMLYVLRHGVAEETAPEGGDRARRLTPEGRKKMRTAADGMRAVGLRFDLILTSPFVRAAETAALVAAAFDGQTPVQELTALEQGVPPVETLRALRPFARRPHLLLVGHEPGLSGLVALLLTGAPDGLRLVLKKGGLVAVEVHDLARRGGATLRWLLTPRHLRRMS